jgi:transglutaminase-like putative cysteine protease
MPDAESTPAGWDTDTAGAVWNAFADLVLKNLGVTDQVGHHMLLLALWVWASSMFAGYAVFGHRRPLNAVALIGVLLVLNMTLTTNDQLVYLVLYSLAALFLLIRSHTFEEQADWLRRRIGDPTTISNLYLRGGTIFITVTVLGALLLTNVAQSKPLAGMWTDLGPQVIEWTRGLSGILPQSGTGPALAPEFGSTSLVRTSWVTSNDPVFRVRLQPGDIGFKGLWRVRTYDVIGVSSLETSATEPLAVAAGEPLLAASGDVAADVKTTPLVFSVELIQSRSEVISPAMAETVDTDVTERTLGAGRYFATLERDRTRDGYTVTAQIPVESDDEGGLTQNKLRTAGTDYDPELAGLYAQPIDRASGVIGPYFDEVMAAIDETGADNAYDLASTIVGYLQDEDNFTYDSDITGDVDCGDESFVECFAHQRRGFCQYYAGLMVALMREHGYAARAVQGYQTGNSDDASGTLRTIRNDQSHAWVEVYFPGYGWFVFDPTGGGQGSTPTLPVGAAQPSASPRASASQLVRPSEAEPSRLEPGATPGVTGGGNVTGPLIVVSILLAVIVGAVAFAAWRRGPRGPVSADGAYGMVTRIASRFGFAPRPNQTVYEYAGSLAEILPEARPQLETVAAAKVEVAYGGRKLGVDRLLSLRDAQRRLRMSLLRLAIRRDARKRRR